MNPLIDKLIDDWGEHLRHSRGRTAETVEKYQANMRMICRMLYIKTLTDLTADNLNQKWLDNIWETIQDKRGLSDNTIQVYQSSLKSFLRYLGQRDLVAPDAWRRISLTKAIEVHITGLSTEEKDRLYTHLVENLKTDSQRRNAAAIITMWTTGIRLSEMLNLRVHPDGIIYTDNPRIQSGDFKIAEGKVWVHINGKGKRNRHIPVSSRAVGFLNLYLEQRAVRSEWVMLHHHSYGEGRRMTKKAAYRGIRAVFAAAGINRPRNSMTHALRHTAIENWIKLGYPTKHIIAMTGHYDERGLEPYFRRSTEIIERFADEGDPMKDVKIPKRAREFESILQERYKPGRNK